jgi:hypothetical protein
VAQVKESTQKFCPRCKREFWDDKREQEKVSEQLYCEWAVDSSGDVLYGYQCGNGHIWLERRESMGDRHRHPGFNGNSDYHDINRKHREERCQHNLPKSMKSGVKRTETNDEV